MDKIKRAIVTGGTGVLGNALINELVSRNIEVLVLVRKNGRIQNIPSHPLVKTEICALEDIGKFTVPKEKYDVFFHLAWNGTYGESRNDSSIQEKNVEYTLDAVRFAYKCGCKKFVGVGSQAENGVLKNGEKISPESPENPVSAYGKAKLRAGKESRKLCEELGLLHNWCRVISVYGPCDAPYTMVMSTLIKMLQNKDCDFTPAEQQWDYIYSGDAAKAFFSVAEKGKNNGIYVIGSGKSDSLKNYILKMAKATGTTAKCNFGALEYYPHQPMYLCADIKNLTDDTGFIPETEFENGIEKTVDYIKNNLV